MKSNRIVARRAQDYKNVWSYFFDREDVVVCVRGAEEGEEMCNEVCYGFCLQRIMAGQAEGL